MWVLFSLFAALCYGLRFAVVKKYLEEIPTPLIAFFARFYGVVVLLPWLLFRTPSIPGETPLFWGILTVTAILTAVSSLLQFHAVKKYQISRSVPFLSFVPLFMMAAVFILYGEKPGINSMWGIVLLAAGSYLINLDKNDNWLSPFLTLKSNRGALLFLMVSLIYGLTTSLDRIPIRLTDAFTYSFYWNLLSLLLFSIIWFRGKALFYWRIIKDNYKGFFLQGVLGAGGFIFQMYGVQFARKISYDVVYVKALTMLQILIAVGAGVVIFKESAGRRKLTAAFLMVCGAAVILIFYRG